MTPVSVFWILTGLLLEPPSGQNKDVDDAEDFYAVAAFRTLKLEFDRPDWRHELDERWKQARNHPDKKTLKADLWVGEKKYANVGVAFKGSSTYQGALSAKLPFKITTDAFKKGQYVMGVNKITLNNSRFDPSLIREVLAYALMGEFLVAPRANWVQLWVNGENLGIYINVERVDKEFFEHRFGANAIHRFRPKRAFLDWKGEEEEVYQTHYRVWSSNPNAAYRALMSLCFALSHTPSDDLFDKLDPIFDIDAALWYLAAINVLAHWDDYRDGHNYFLCQRPTDQRFFIVPWDFDRTLAERPDRNILLGLGTPHLPLFGHLMESKEIRDRYLHHVRVMARDLLDWGKIRDWLETPREFLSKHIVDSNHEITTPNKFEQHLRILENFFNQRRKAADSHPWLTDPGVTIASVSTSMPKSKDDRLGIKVSALIKSNPDLPIQKVRMFTTICGNRTVTDMHECPPGRKSGEQCFSYLISIPEKIQKVTFYLEVVSGSEPSTKRVYAPKYAAFRPFVFDLKTGTLNTP